MKNYVAGSSSNYLKLSYWAVDGTAWTADVATKQFPASYLNSDEYVTVQMELPDSFRSEGGIETLRLQVMGLESPSATQLGTMTIDYIYVGPKATAPTDIRENDYLLFDFGNSEADRNRYANDPAYGVYNFDLANWASSNSTGTYSIDPTAGTASIDVTDSNSSGYGPYFATTSTNGTFPNSNRASYAPLSYRLPENAVMKLRFKVSGCETTGTPYVHVRLHYKDGSGTAKYEQTIKEPYTYGKHWFDVTTTHMLRCEIQATAFCPSPTSNGTTAPPRSQAPPEPSVSSLTRQCKRL